MFPDFPIEDMPQFPEGFVDSSWHNDTCPSFTDSVLRVLVYVDYVDVDLRERFNGKRFAVLRLDEEGTIADCTADCFESDDWTDVQAELRRIMREHVCA
jgi:hypothetical protein